VFICRRLSTERHLAHRLGAADWLARGDGVENHEFRECHLSRHRGPDPASAGRGMDWTLRRSGLRFNSSAAAGTSGKYALRPVTRTLGLAATTTVGSNGGLTVDSHRARRTGERDHTLVNVRYNCLPFRLSVEGLNLGNATYVDASAKAGAARSILRSRHRSRSWREEHGCDASRSGEAAPRSMRPIQCRSCHLRIHSGTHPCPDGVTGRLAR
jgi:hypothetical protein